MDKQSTFSILLPMCRFLVFCVFATLLVGCGDGTNKGDEVSVRATFWPPDDTPEPASLERFTEWYKRETLLDKRTEQEINKAAKNHYETYLAGEFRGWPDERLYQGKWVGEDPTTVFIERESGKRISIPKANITELHKLE